MWEDNSRLIFFSIEKALLNIVEWFEVKNVLMMDLFLKNMQFFSSRDINWWTGGVDY